MAELILFLVSIGAGFLGSILGLGGGIIIVPVLTLFFHINIRYAVAASLISIVATSSGAAARFLNDRLTNIRLAVVLEVGTTCGAIVGFVLAKFMEPRMLFLLFGSFLLISAISMLQTKGDPLSTVGHPWSHKLKLGGRYLKKKVWVAYEVEKVPLGLFSMFFAGVLSALLGIGSGIFKVIAMDRAMKLPIKVSSATSNFMIGVTAAGSAGAYMLHGDIRAEIAAPVSLGIIVGSWFGAQAMVKIPAALIRKVFVVVLVIVSFQMIHKGLVSQ